MSVFHNNILAGASGASAAAAGGFAVKRSLRLNPADNAHLSFTPSSAGNRRKWTWSGWIKRSNIGSSTRWIFTTSNGSANEFDIISFDSSNNLKWEGNNGSGSTYKIEPSYQFRDPGAWMHLVLAVDTTQSTASNRLKLYINGDQVTSLSSDTYPPQNYDCRIGTTNQIRIGSNQAYASSQNFAGYIAEVHFVDGQQLEASDFGEYDDNENWNPKDCSSDLTYGTNGYNLTFEDNTSTTTIAEDSSGNSNDWTANNISVSSGVGNDSLFDSPSNYDDGTNVGGNFCTMNPLTTNGAITFSNGNLDTVNPGGTQDNPRGTMGVSSGKWYWECEITAFAGGFHVGIATPESKNQGFLGNNSGEWAYGDSGKKYIEGSASNYGASFASVGEVVSVVFDADAGTLTFWNDGVSQGQAVSGLTNGPYLPAMYARVGSTGGSWNFGQRPFTYTPPSGYKALCTQNLDESDYAPFPNGADAFNVLTYTGDNSSSRSFTLDYAPDIIWLKGRSTSANHALYDVIRGAGVSKSLETNSNANESGSNTNATYGYVSSFDSSGFSVVKGTHSGFSYTNRNTETYCAWHWDAGTSTASNTDGSRTTSVRANTSAGISVVTFNDGNSANTYGHGLNAAPEFIIVKTTSTTGHWFVYHKNVGASKYLRLNKTSEENGSNHFNNTAPTSSVFSLGSDASFDADQVAYCFTSIPGFSKIGYYTGNGNTGGFNEGQAGPWVYLGFSPRWIMLKNTTQGDSDSKWLIYDTARSVGNGAKEALFANTDQSEQVESFHRIDLLSNGFKVGSQSNNSLTNTNNSKYVYLAFASHPFRTARAR